MSYLGPHHISNMELFHKEDRSSIFDMCDDIDSRCQKSKNDVISIITQSSKLLILTKYAITLTSDTN